MRFGTEDLEHKLLDAVLNEVPVPAEEQLISGTQGS